MTHEGSLEAVSSTLPQTRTIGLLPRTRVLESSSGIQGGEWVQQEVTGIPLEKDLPVETTRAECKCSYLVLVTL